MINTILGSKLNMTHTFADNMRVPLTLVQAGPCIVTQIKNMEKDGYWAVQIAFGSKKTKNTSKALQGHFKKSTKNFEKNSPRYIREVRVSEEPDLKVGQTIKLTDIFSIGDEIVVTGTSKGKGFAGGVKRWGFAGGPKTHGQSDRHRAPGSIGQGTTPGRVYKGKHMAGRMGGETKTIENLRVVSLDAEKGLLGVLGGIPGSTNSLITVTRVSESKVDFNTQNEEAAS